MAADTGVLAATIERFQRGLEGRPCRVERRECDWSFDFGDGWTIAVSATWRMVSGDGLACTSSDYEAHTPSPGGLGDDPFLKRLLKKRRAAGADLDPATGDLHIRFDSGLRLDVFNDSVGYEPWAASFSIDGEPAILVGAPGGGFAIPVAVYRG